MKSDFSSSLKEHLSAFTSYAGNCLNCGGTKHSIDETAYTSPPALVMSLTQIWDD